MKELKSAILSQNHRPSRGWGGGVVQGVWIPSVEMTKIQFLLASLRTTVLAYNSN